MVTTVSASVEGRSKEQTVATGMDISYDTPVASDSVAGVEVNVPPEQGAQVDDPTQVPTDPPSQPEPEPMVSQAPVEADSAEGTICQVWSGVSCVYILAVARCESGPDYYDDWSDGGYYVGTFQLDPNLHGWRFLAHGWNIWTDGQDIYKNSVVAYELYLDNGMAPWPVCRYV